MTAALAMEIAVDPIRWTGDDVVTATGARPVARVRDPSQLFFTTACIDSRCVADQALFIALRGPNHDAHDYVGQALAAGATAALVERVPEAVDAAKCLLVADTLRGLGDLAHWCREQNSALQVLAITGSNGKTTTKEMFASICDEAMRDVPGTILKTAGNQNNLVGLPLTLLRMGGTEAVAILEMGMNQPGEIARLTEIARPDFGVITNVGAAHLEGLGSLDGVAAAKGELFAGMADTATIAVNVDDERVRRLAQRFPGRQVAFGAGAEVCATDLVDRGFVDRGFVGSEMKLHAGGDRVDLRLAFAGLHNVQNALAAAALGYAMGFPLATIAAGLAAARPPAMRMQVVALDNGVVLVDDSYNANPSSVIAGLRAAAVGGRRSWAVLGEMRELGGHSARLHREVGAEAARLGIDYLVAVGPHAGETAGGARGEAGGIWVHECADASAAAELVRSQWRDGDVVLVKGSRGADDEPAVRRYGSRMAEVVALLGGKT